MAAESSGLTFKTQLGRGVYDVLFGPQAKSAQSVSDQFLPKRTAFLYELEDMFAGDIPTTLRRAKEDCPKPKDTMFASVDSAVLDRLAKLMAYMSSSSKLYRE